MRAATGPRPLWGCRGSRRRPWAVAGGPHVTLRGAELSAQWSCSELCRCPSLPAAAVPSGLLTVLSDLAFLTLAE